MLRCSNRSFFSNMELEVWTYIPGIHVSDPDRFDRVVAATLTDLVSLLVANVSTAATKKYFATKEAKFTESQKLYALAQCTPDISSSDCKMCIHYAMEEQEVYCKGQQRTAGSIFLWVIIW